VNNKNQVYFDSEAWLTITTCLTIIIYLFIAMRKLKIKTIPVDDASKKLIEKRIREVNHKAIMLEDLIGKIDKGNIEQIDDLLMQCEMIILKVMLHLPSSQYSIDVRLAHAKKALKQLAIHNSVRTSRDIFNRFCVFYIRQSLIALENINPCTITTTEPK
jgi:hypothetical protein